MCQIIHRLGASRDACPASAGRGLCLISRVLSQLSALKQCPSRQQSATETLEKQLEFAGILSNQRSKQSPYSHISLVHVFVIKTMERAHKQPFLRAWGGQRSCPSLSLTALHTFHQRLGQRASFWIKLPIPYSFSSFLCCQAAARGMPRSRAQKESLPGPHVPRAPQLATNLCAKH